VTQADPDDILAGVGCAIIIALTALVLAIIAILT